MDTKTHWERIYTDKPPTELSWYQEHPNRSLDLIERTGIPTSAPILDVGGGDSTLVDHLVALGFRAISVIDLSSAALARARARLGPNAQLVEWREANILSVDLPPRSIDLWHDRAVFHFLSRPADRATYIERVQRVLRPGGHVIVATFAEDGPLRCSGLPVERYSAAELHATFGARFHLVESLRESHRTPGGVEQRFTYCWFTHKQGLVPRG